MELIDSWVVAASLLRSLQRRLRYHHSIASCWLRRAAKAWFAKKPHLKKMRVFGKTEADNKRALNSFQ
jgi:hypothetical protein